MAPGRPPPASLRHGLPGQIRLVPSGHSPPFSSLPGQHQGMTPPAAHSCLQYPNNPYPARLDDCHPVQILMLLTPNDAMHEHFRSNQRTSGHHVLMWVTVCCIRSAKEAVPSSGQAMLTTYEIIKTCFQYMQCSVYACNANVFLRLPRVPTRVVQRVWWWCRASPSGGWT